jgi:hypothetical protein
MISALESRNYRLNGAVDLFFGRGVVELLLECSGDELPLIGSLSEVEETHELLANTLDCRKLSLELTPEQLLIVYAGASRISRLEHLDDPFLVAGTEKLVTSLDALLWTLSPDINKQ